MSLFCTWTEYSEYTERANNYRTAERLGEINSGLEIILTWFAKYWREVLANYARIMWISVPRHGSDNGEKEGGAGRGERALSDTMGAYRGG